MEDDLLWCRNMNVVKVISSFDSNLYVNLKIFIEIILILNKYTQEVCEPYYVY